MSLFPFSLVLCRAGDFCFSPGLSYHRYLNRQNSTFLISDYANGKSNYKLKEQGQVWIVEEYDPAANQWVQKADLPMARYLTPPNAPTAGGLIYIIGGQEEVG